LWRLDTSSPVLLEELRYVVEGAAKNAPDDHRVWLAQAHLATRTARYEEAARWLEKCLSLRPRDPAGWRCQLGWARTTQDLSRARRALEHLTDAQVSPEELLAIRAWFAARTGDVQAERRALERLIAIAPGRLAAMDRLAALAKQAGDGARAARLRGRKA